jgi:hypothetical protein
MTRDEVMKIARQAGAERSCINDKVWMLAMAETSFEHFAALVAEAEREACAQVCEGRLQEGLSFEGCAAAIRARGNT